MTTCRPAGNRWLAAVLLVGALVAACDGRDERAEDSGEAGAAPLPASIARPDFTLLDTDGRPFAFRERTVGTLTFLFFGYTHCPDVCPVHAANIAAALRALPFEQRARVRVVFVTVDPVRDSAAVIRRWLDMFDAEFVGLHGAADSVAAIQVALGFGPSFQTPPDSAGNYDVAHAAPVILFSPDDTAHAVYPFGTRRSNWATIISRELRPRS